MSDRDETVRMVPDANFEARLIDVNLSDFESYEGVFYFGPASAPPMDPNASLQVQRRQVHYRVCDEILYGTPLRDVGWAELFAYMHRRFGPPLLACNDLAKHLSEPWALGTPDPDVVLLVAPSLSGPAFSFFVTVRKGLTRADLKDRAAQAYRTTLLDLLRPVWMRDQAMNAMGEVEPYGCGLDHFSVRPFCGRGEAQAMTQSL